MHWMGGFNQRQPSFIGWFGKEEEEKWKGKKVENGESHRQEVGVISWGSY